MKRIFAFLTSLLTIIINVTVFAQAGSVPPPQKRVGWERFTNKSADRSLLWKISGKGLAKPSYLFGTIHQICPGDYLWTDIMNHSLNECDKVCFEMNLDDPNVMMQVATGLIDMSGKKLKDYFTPAQYERVKRYMKDSMGMDIALFEQMKPIALESMIGLKEGSCDSPTSYEETIMKTAKDHKQGILGLEEAKEQLDVLETIPVDTVIKQLIDALDNLNSNMGDTTYQQMITAYKQQDLPALYTMITQSKELGDGMDAFLDIRNKKWIPRMTEKMNKNSVFFAVGAGHLYGDNGVITLLRKEGYTVQAMK